MILGRARENEFKRSTASGENTSVDFLLLSTA
jgi:hypothetical protein